MKELEDTKCEIRRVIDLQFSIRDRLSNQIEDEGGSLVGSPGYTDSFKPLGGFFEDSTYAWLSCGPRLLVLNVKTGISISFWTFRYPVSCVSQFPAQPGQVPLLLVGLDNGANKIRNSAGLLCVFDCTTSQVIRAIQMPAGVERVCVVMSGTEGEEFADKRIDNLLSENSGMACVALRNLDHLMIDLRRMSWDGVDSTTIADESNPAELDFAERNTSTASRHRSNRERHAVYNLMNSRLEEYIGFNREEFESSTLYQETLTTAMICSRKIGCLVSGCLGRIIIWQTDGAVRWVSLSIDENLSVSHLALLEPTDDPRPFCYLWVAYQEESSNQAPVLRMYAMLFDRKYSDKGTNAYFNLEGDPSFKFELELEEGNRVTSLYPIVRESNREQTESGNKHGEESLLLINLDDRTLLFDLNQWYKEQMPQTIGECQNPNAILASYRTRSVENTMTCEPIIDSGYLPTTLKDFSSNGPSPPEELFFPNSLSLEWVDLGTGRLTFWMTRGIQAEILREMSIAGPVILIDPTETYNRCFTAGLIPVSVECSFTSDKDVQRETLLSLCLEQHWSTFLLKCAKEWSDGSAAYLFPAFLRWGVQRAASIKLMTHRLTIPLFDHSGNTIGEAEVKTLRFFSQQLECLSNIVANLLVETSDLTKQRRVLRRTSTYLQVLLWFYNVGLLPETQDTEDESSLPIPFILKIPYPFERLATIYKEKRERFRSQSSMSLGENEQDLFIDELIMRECAPLKSQWEREGGELSTNGNYPPPSLQSLLRSFLIDCYSPDTNEMDCKHQITMYLLMDLEMLLQGSCPRVDQLIKYPSAFKLSPSLIKLTQALWLLDHEDYQGFLDMMTGQLVSDSDVKDWHHKFVLRTLIRNNQNKLALMYIRIRKPPLSSLEDQGMVISLSVEHGLVQSAFHRRPASHSTQLLTRFFQACKAYGKLNDILHLSLDADEEEAFVKFLEDEKFEETLLLYYLQRCRYVEANNVYPMLQPMSRGTLQKTNKSTSLMILNAYNATLPEITKKFSANMIRKSFDIDPESRYPRPLSHCKNRGRTREIYETVIKKAKETFLRGERSQIPFISAPCASLRSGTDNVDTNCVLFVERAKKPYGKRTLDDMRGESSGTNENSDDRKRRKTSGDDNAADKSGDKELGMSMVFDTPLIKRKNQMINSRNTPIETPHSILKIRELIRESTSTSASNLPSTDSPSKKIAEKDRKPRQIRFSIGKPTNDDSTAKDHEEDNAESDDNPAQGDITEENDEIEKSVAKADISEEDGSEDAFYSPNVSSKSLSESTMLSDNSSICRNVSGPRPRPSLRRSNISNESLSTDLLKRLLTRSSDASTKSSWTPTTLDSTKVSKDLSISTSEGITNVIATNTLRSPRARPSLLGSSMYTASFLSTDTSFERTTESIVESGITPSTEDNESSFGQDSFEKCRDTSSNPTLSNKTGISRRFSHAVSVKSVMKSSTLAEYDGEFEDDKNSVVLMEVDGFGLDRAYETQSSLIHESTRELDRLGERGHSFSVSTVQSVTIAEEIEMKSQENSMENHDEENDNNKTDIDKIATQSDLEERQDDWNSDKIASSQDVPSQETEENSNETEKSKRSDDCDDELLTLKYDDDDDDDNEEVYRSLSNSIEVEDQNARSSLEKTIPFTSDDLNKKSAANNGFFDVPKVLAHDVAITDDESSQSIEGSILTVDTINSEVKNKLDRTVSIQDLQEDFCDNVSNITEDESNGSLDSSSKHSKNPESEAHGINKINSMINVDKIVTESSNTATDKLMRSTSELVDEKESECTELSDDSSLSLKRGKESMRVSKVAPATPKQSKSSAAKRDLETLDVKPQRMTRSSRASSLLQETLDSPRPESPASKPTPEKISRPRRASSVVQELTTLPVSESSPAKSSGEAINRPRRASSLVKDTFSTSVKGAEVNSVGRAKSTVSENVLATPPRRRSVMRRSSSLANDIFPTVSSLTEELQSSKAEELPIRRSTRRAASVQKEIPEVIKPSAKGTRSSSKTSLLEETVDEEPVTTVGKKTRRGKRETSVSEETEKNVRPKRSSKTSLLSENSPDATEAVNKRPTRKRANSVPKETTVDPIARTASLRTRRANSVAKTIIPEEPDETIEDFDETGRILSSTRISDAASSESPVVSSRKRLLSITSIPEEAEEIFDKKLKAKGSSSSSTEKKTASTARQRRAVSVDPPQIETKRVTRAALAKSAISEDPIAEDESLEAKVAEGEKAKMTRKTAPVRRKRTASGTSIKEYDDEVFVKKPSQRRTRKLSQKTDDPSDSFQFSPPDQTQNRPDDKRAIGEVPDYVFSPPHTRSKDTTPVQPRRKVRDFISPLTEEQKRRAMEKLSREDKPVRIVSSGRTGKSFVPPRARTIFVLPKRSQSTSK